MSYKILLYLSKDRGNQFPREASFRRVTAELDNDRLCNIDDISVIEKSRYSDIFF